MNQTFAPEFSTGLSLDLRAFVALCENVLTLANRENQTLADASEYPVGEFHEQRQRLLPELDLALAGFRKRRELCRQSDRTGHSEEIKGLFQSIQSLVMKILFLDRENQQALLRRGLMPAKHLPPVATQQPHFVGNLYQRHSTVAGNGPA